MSVKAAAPRAGEAAGSAAWGLAHQACREAGIDVHQVHAAAECRGVVDLLNVIWGASDLDIIDVAFMIALAHSGNLVAVATRSGSPTGAAVGFSGPPSTPFHSHIVGVVPEAAGHGVGRALKLYQRAWCLERGVATMAWTYDPLVARNGYFNIRRLGALPRAYHCDFYGTMSDAINAGQLSDRMVVGWDLTSTPPSVGSGAVDLDLGSGQIALSNDRDVPGAFQPPRGADGAVALLGVPRDIEGIRRDDPDLAHIWRVRTREAFTNLLSDGWVIRDFTRSGHYVLHHERTP